MKNLENILSQIPDFAKDIKINLQNLLINEEVITKKQAFGCALAIAYALKDKKLIEAFEDRELLSEIEINAIRTSSILMSMNNIYYRFTHLSEDKEYGKMPAGLRMKGIADHGIDKVDFEMFSFAVSVLNGCSGCIDAHAHQLLKHEISKNQIQTIAKIASVVNALSKALYQFPS